MLKTLLSSYDRALKVNLTNDTYLHVIADGDDVRLEKGSAEFLSDVLKAYGEKGFIYKDDLADYRRYTSISYLSEYFAATHGEDAFWLKYRRRVTDVEGNTSYRWSILRVSAAEDYSDENQNVYMFIDDIEQSYHSGTSRLEDVLLAISGNYKSIFYVDINAQKVFPYRLRDDLQSGLMDAINNGMQYEELIKLYISMRVHPDDQQRIQELTSIAHIQKVFNDTAAFTVDYKLKSELGSPWFRMKIARIDAEGERFRFTIGFADISEDKQVEDDYFRAGKKILVVEDSDVNRAILCAILETEYDVIEAINGEEAFTLLQDNHEEVAIILTDLEMPVMNGFDFIGKVRAERIYNSIPIIVTTASNEIHVEVKCLKLGASDFVSKPYNPEVVRHRVRSLIKLRESTAMLNTLEKDALTGLYTKEFFYQHVSDVINQNPNTDYDIFCTDIENFKVVNEKYGTQVGDKVLSYLADEFPKVVPGYVMGGRISGDRFAVLRKAVPFKEYPEVFKRINTGAPVSNVVVKYGVYHVDREYTVQGMCDRALIAVETIKGKYGVNLLVYDDDLRKNLLKQQQIIDNMESALSEEQFVVYYQPKHDIRNDSIGGAEALVRWIHPTYGFMNPGDFIPLFEKNGFITQVDSYVYEQVCKNIVEWIKEGRNVVPISINLSRRDFERVDLLDFIINTADKYKLPHELLHIEITESAFSDNPKHIAEVVNGLHEAGFCIELDDFGSGYSSLTTLSALDIDIMKLDMSLVRNDDPTAEKSALEFSMQLARMLNIKTVSEGVETETQMQRIKSLGGDYIQGYFYSKPLPRTDFEKYIDEH